jgi:hypothetical protein
LPMKPEWFRCGSGLLEDLPCVVAQRVVHLL